MPDIHHLLNIDAPASRIYQAVSTVEGIKGWWTVQCYGDFSLNGEVHFDFNEEYRNTFLVKGMEDDKQIIFEGKECAPDWRNTLIDIRLEETEGKTVVRFSHLKYPEANDFYAGCNYSWGYFLKSLKEFAETGKGFPFTGD